jgi:hypothetical protein
LFPISLIDSIILIGLKKFIDRLRVTKVEEQIIGRIVKNGRRAKIGGRLPRLKKELISIKRIKLSKNNSPQRVHQSVKFFLTNPRIIL